MISKDLHPSPSPADARRIASKMRVVIVHDWLLGMRGGERVLESLLALFPKAEICTLFYDPKGISSTINSRPIHASGLSSLPAVGFYYRTLLPFMPGIISNLELPAEADLVISTSHCVAHGVRVPPGIPHLVYCFSPMRYLYDQQGAYSRGGSSVSTRLLRAIAARLEAWDARAARRCTRYWAISDFVADRISRVYGRDARVIHPPVRTDFFTPVRTGGKGSGEGDPGSADNLNRNPAAALDAPWLVVSALTGYKRVDLAVAAANTLGLELIVVGRGPNERELHRLAGRTVRFVGWVDDAKLRELYRSCRGLIFPGEEDFGIVPLEAMACGKPVLALRAGGLCETLSEGICGEFFEASNEKSLVAALKKFDPEAYDPTEIRRHAESFGEDRFLDEFAVNLVQDFEFT